MRQAVATVIKNNDVNASAIEHVAGSDAASLAPSAATAASFAACQQSSLDRLPAANKGDKEADGSETLRAPKPPRAVGCGKGGQG